MKSSRILSSRHFSWLIKAKSHFTNLNNLIFLVKDVTTKTFHWTQHFSPSVKPIAAYLHGFDITRFLTHRNQLTAYSYYFINYVYSLGFTIHDVRSYFHGFVRVTSKQPDQKRLTERGVNRPYKRRPVTEAAVSSEVAAKQLDATIPLDHNSVGYKLYQSFVNEPRSTTIVRTVNKKFEDSRVFSTAWKLACSQLLPFKFSDTKVELIARLTASGFSKSVLIEFKTYLDCILGTDVDYVSLVNDTARQFGYSRSKTKSNVEMIENTFSLTSLCVGKDITGYDSKTPSYEEFVQRLFPESVELPKRKQG